AAVNLTEKADDRTSRLSGGQLRRVGLAQVLVGEPEVLLLDEPFTGVDMPTQEQLTELFIELSEAGTTLVMTTHDLAQAMA
ncbi:ATP-binding cassette domain-containing protein, partial [Xanthomonas citri pv. citri]|nr:ATP-binding cassette domain-containing protein [Xanthomonas citri pv. citri]